MSSTSSNRNKEEGSIRLYRLYKNFLDFLLHVFSLSESSHHSHHHHIHIHSYRVNITSMIQIGTESTELERNLLFLSLFLYFSFCKSEKII